MDEHTTWLARTASRTADKSAGQPTVPVGAATAVTTEAVDDEAVPPPRRRAKTGKALGLTAVQLVQVLGLLPLATSIVTLAAVSRRPTRPALPSPALATMADGRPGAAARRRGHPQVYSDATVLVLALLGRLWHLSTRELCDWLGRWSALGQACGLPPGRIIHPAHLSRRGHCQLNCR